MFAKIHFPYKFLVHVYFFIKIYLDDKDIFPIKKIYKVNIGVCLEDLEFVCYRLKNNFVTKKRLKNIFMKIYFKIMEVNLNVFVIN